MRVHMEQISYRVIFARSFNQWNILYFQAIYLTCVVVTASNFYGTGEKIVNDLLGPHWKESWELDLRQRKKF